GAAVIPGAVYDNGTSASFNYPPGVAVDGSGNVYVAEQNNDLIRKISPNGDVTTLAGTGITGAVNGTGTSASFYYPYGVAVDGSGNVYVADTYNHLIRKILG
ncbi:MAG: sugar lactone lactonase YvrE, partial [Ilumatobacter sp.]